jgi:hypothetical protein
MVEIYEALQNCRPNRNQLMRRYLQKLPKQEDYVFPYRLHQLAKTRVTDA